MSKPSGRRAVLRAKPVALAVAVAFLPWGEAFAEPAPNTVPTNGTYTAGTGTILPVTPENHLRIEQASQKGIIEWGTFSIGSAASVHFQQAFDRQGLTLNRVIGNSASEIFGRLTSNGQLFLVNNAGVLFAPSASVSAAAIVASTLSIADQNFLDGNYQFFNPGNAGSVVNQGSIVTAGGYTALVGPQVTNSGVIMANSGKVALGAGDRVSLDIVGDGLLSISVTEAAASAALVNTGTLQADGGTVLLKANSTNALLDTVINTSGIVRANALIEHNGEIVLDARGAVAVSGLVETGGTVNIVATGALTVESSVASDARISSNTGQTITAQSVRATAQNGHSVQIVNNVSGDQAITVTGGAADTGLTLQNLGGPSAFITNFAPTHQRILVSDADHIRVDGRAGNANISNPQGEQTVSITGNRSNAIVIGSDGNIGRSIINGSSQTITAGNADESGSITLTGGAVNLASGSIVNLVVNPNAPVTPINTQTVRTSGTLAIAGGTATGQTASAGIFQNRPGQQTVSAANIVMQGGPSGSGNGAFINATFGGDQVLTVPGDLRITGGDGGTANRAGIVTNANQTITGNPNIVLTGGGGGVAGNGNNVFIQSNGDDTKRQTINAGTIQLRSGAGTDASATLNAARQVITTTGDVSLFGGAGPGGLNGVRIGGIGGTTLGPTNLTLNVGGNLLLSGGTVNGASLGSSGASTQANTINVTASGDIVLESNGAGARIGSSSQVGATPGNISVTAGESLQLGNGTAVRANGPITLTANGLTNDGTITNGGGANTGNVILVADAFHLAGGNIQAGAAGVFLRPRTATNSLGIESAGATTLTNADIASINTSNFVGFGSGIGTNFIGNIAIGENAQVVGGAKNLVFFRSLSAGGTTTIGTHGVATTGDVIVAAGGGSIVSNGGTVAGDEVQLRAAQGIGAPGARVHTAANALTAGTSGDAFVTEANDVTLRTIVLDVGGNTVLNTTNTGTGGVLDLTVGGALNVAGSVSSGGLMNINAAGPLNVTGAGTQDGILSSSGGQTITAQSVNLMAQNGRRANIENFIAGNQSITATAGDMNLQVPGGFGVAQIINNTPGGNQTVEVAGQLNVLGGVISPTGSRNSGIFKNGGLGLQTVSASGITLQGASSGTVAGAIINSQGDQFINVAGGNINLIGGSGGTSNSATIGASATGQQTILAHDINLSNGVGGTDTVAAIVGGHQLIDATGSATLTAQGALVSPGAPALPGVRIGAPGGSTTGTDLTLLVDGNLMLQGGTAANNGVGIGSSGAGVAQQNTIVIDVGGSVILNSGSGTNAGARIGSSPQNGLAGGNISITADGSIALNGTDSTTSIRTLGSVTLEAASISEASNGFILANTLTTRSTGGNTSLTGPNEVSSYNGTSSGDLGLTNTGTLTVTGLNAGGDATLNNTGNVTVSGPWTAGGTSSITVASDIVLDALLTSTDVVLNAGGGSITEIGAGAVIANTLSTAAGATTSLTGANQVQSFNGFTAFGAGGDISLNNIGPLSVTGLNAGGNATLLNQGAVNVTGLWSSFGSTDIRTTGGGLTLTNSLSSAGAMTLDIGGTLTLSANGPQTAQLITNNGGQTITAQSVEVVAQGGGFASIFNNGGDQRITINGSGTGAGLDVHTLASGGLAQIGQNTPGFTQTIEVTDADHINVNGAGLAPFPGSGAGIFSAGTQTLSITGSGANAITVGSLGARGASGVGGPRQSVTAGLAGEQGSIAIVGSDAQQALAGFVTNPVAGGTQTISTSGTISVTGGRAPVQLGNFPAGIFHNGTGQQTITAADIVLTGGPSGNNNAALISVPGGGVPANAGAQSINVSGDITIAGGPGGNAGIVGSATRQQTIFADSISLTNSAAGGNNSVGFIQGGHQEIHAAGDVTLTARASGGDLPGVRIGGAGGTNATATDLRMFIGGDLVLTGGTAVNNGVGIGSTGVAGAPALANNITINTGGSVILNSGTQAGTGVRIGSSAATGAGPGNISITAGGGIELNGVEQGTAIRTLDTVTLVADHITEAANGFIVAGTLNTTTHGDATLSGPNRVDSFTAASDTGNVSLRNTAPVLTLGSMDLPGTLTIDQTGTLSIPGTVSALSHTIDATGDVLVGSAGATSAALLSAAEGISISSGGNVSLTGGSSAGSSAQITGHGPIDISVGGNVSVMGGSGDGAFARILGYSDINLTVGGFITLGAGTGVDAWARVELDSRDSVIRIHFPNLASGGYFVNGIEGLLRDGHTGFLAGNGVAAPGHQFITTYGAP